MNSKRLFVFDMDGVLVDSEKVWLEEESTFLDALLGKEISRRIGNTIGISMGEIYQKAYALGFRMDRAEYDRRYNETAIRVYARCTISKGADTLVDYLATHGWQLALLSASPRFWIEQVLRRLSWRDRLGAVLSLNEHKELRPKPAPDGYRFLLRKFNVEPNDSVALEDSNPGIASAKEAGLFTIGYWEHLPGGYAQDPADATADTMQDVLAILTRGTIAP